MVTHQLSREENLAYAEWQHDFMFHRLKTGLIITAVALLTFIWLNLLLDSQQVNEMSQAWLFINSVQELAVLCCLVLLHTRIGRNHLALVFLGFSWSLVLIPHYQSVQFNTVVFDSITWTLTFLGLATLVPIRWWLHLLSQFGVLIHFVVMYVWFDIKLGALISVPDLIIYLYFFWFCVICDISVYLYERLKRTEFKAGLILQAKHIALQEEQEKSEHLLLNILPESIANRLKQQEQTIADQFSEASVLFADIVDFTKLSTRLSASQLVELLNKIFSAFDKLVEKPGLEKIKTIGDAYMVVAGLPTPCKNHLTQIADFALDMQQTITDFNDQYHDKLSIRIGIHTGPVVAGVIGIKKFTYDLWGDTVNIASRMESHGIAGRIQVSDSVYNALKDKYVLVKRGTIAVKGKGEMTTYFLETKRHNPINLH